MSTNKLERLLNLTAVLLDTSRPLSAEDLRQRVEGYPPPGSAFHRAFERDKDDLRVLGVPLRVERVPATDPPVDGYRIESDEYYLPDPGLEPDELAALHLASITVRLDGLGDEEALWKLGGLATGTDLGAPAAEDADLLDGVVASLPTDPNLVPIFQAITDREVVGFRYNQQERTVDPWRLDFHRGRWYLTGFDHDRQDERNFRLDRLESPVEAKGETMTSTPPQTTKTGPAKPWMLGEEQPTVARLLVDADRVSMARRQLGQEVESEEQPDGSHIFAVPVINWEAFRTFVLGFLDSVEILQPPEWREDIADWLSAIATQGEAAK